MGAITARVESNGKGMRTSKDLMRTDLLSSLRIATARLRGRESSDADELQVLTW